MSVDRLQETLDKLIEFGTNPNLGFNDNVLELKKALIELYAVFATTEDESDDKDYDENFEFSYSKIRKTVEKNFPELGQYSTILNCTKIDYEVNSGKPIVNPVLGDSIDDISDIIKDMMEVQWRFTNTSKKDAIWHFKFLMNTHSEIHLVDLLRYLKDFKG